MSETGNRDTVTRYLAASAANDWDALGRLRAAEWVEEWPQSGERIRGTDNYRRIHEQFPGGMPQYDIHRVVGSEDRWVASPLFTPVKIIGSGDAWMVEGLFRYPNGETYIGIKHLELHDGRVAHETTYWAPSFEAPEWRRAWVELDAVEADQGGGVAGPR
jgi:SnoaL-like protein